MGAVELLRGRGELPTSGAGSVMDLMQSFRPSPPGSMRALLLKMFGSVAVKRPWAVILCRFKDSSPDPALEGPIERFYREAFTPGTGGLVEFWRDASLGAIDITGSRVFGWVKVEIPRDKAGGTPESAPPGPGRSGLIDYAVNALKHSEGDNALQGLLGPIVVYTQNWSKDDVPPGADWSTPGYFQFWIDGSADGGRVCLTPPHNGNITAHEMGHVFGMQHDVGGADFKTHYADPCCIMSQNGAFTHPRWGTPFGPALCLPHLVQRDWIYKRRVYYDNGGWLSQSDGITLPLAPISNPSARANLGIKLAYTPGNWDYYLEYVIPTEWNRGVIGAPYLFIRRIAASDVGPTPAYLGAIGVGQTTEFLEPTGNVRFRVEPTSLPNQILIVNIKKL